MANHSPVKDSGGFFQIIPASRQVKVPADQKAIGAVGDHLSEQLTFECPQFIDGHDVSGCARKYVTWKNVDGEMGHDELTVDKTEEGNLYLVWTIRNALTSAKGLVQFSVHFEDVAEDGESIVYRWSTLTNQNCEILDAINAQLATYAAVYVNGDTLCIADYTPVHNGVLALDMTPIIPEGVKVINEAGVHDVALFAEVDVQGLYEDPTIEVDEVTGVITATANGKESTAELNTDVTVTITAQGESAISSEGNPSVAYYTRDGLDIKRTYINLALNSQPITIKAVRGFICIQHSGADISTADDCVGCRADTEADFEMFVSLNDNVDTASFTINIAPRA